MGKWWIWILILILIILLAAAAYWYMNKAENEVDVKVTPNTQEKSSTPSTKAADEEKQGEKEQAETTKFQNIKTPHFVSSNPENNAVLTTTVSKVTITFNFDLAAGSKITVKADGNLVNTPDSTKISGNKLSMSQTINPIEPADYKVDYTACWPDGSCHQGSFGYTVK